MILSIPLVVEKNHTRVGNKIREKIVIELSPRLGTNMARIVKVKKTKRGQRGLASGNSASACDLVPKSFNKGMA
jgi:hypothetical protein